jgi:hypothetical protein
MCFERSCQRHALEEFPRRSVPNCSAERLPSAIKSEYKHPETKKQYIPNMGSKAFIVMMTLSGWRNGIKTFCYSQYECLEHDYKTTTQK